MSAKRRDWVLLTLTLLGAGIGQWAWLAKTGPFIVGLGCYFIALISWLKLTRGSYSRPSLDRTVGLAWAGGLVFATLALLVGLRGPENSLIAVFLVAIALAYFFWAFSHGQALRVVRLWALDRRATWLSNDQLTSVTQTAFQDTRHWIRTNPTRAVLFTGSLLIVIGAGLAAHRGQRPSAHLVSLGAWGLGLALLVLAFVPSQAARRLTRALQTLTTKHRLETIFVVTLWGLAIAVRIINLGGIPTILTGDEGAMGLEAVKVLKGEQVNPFSTGWTSHPTLYFYNLALFIRFFGQNIAGLRLASALAGAFTIPITYLLARRSFNITVASISALFLTGYHVHIHYSRLALNNIWSPLAAVLTLFLLWEGLRTRQSWLFALGGIAMGLGQYTYFGARLLPVIVIAWLFYLGSVSQPSGVANGVHDQDQNRYPALTRNGGHLAIFWLAFFLALLPLSWFFLEHWNAFTSRIAQVGVFGSTGVDPTQDGYLAPLASGLFKSVLAFNYFRDRSIFYGPPLPLLHWLSGIALFFGVVQALRRWRRAGHGLVLIWLLGTVIFGGALMNHPPESPRLLFAAPAIAMLVALGLMALTDQIAGLFKRTFKGGLLQKASDGRRLAVITALVATAISGFYYFGVYTPADRFGDPKTRLAHHMGIWARDLEPGHRVFFFGAPRMTYQGFPSISFLAPNAEIEDVIEPIENPLPIKSLSTFVFTPQRLDELEIIAAAHPAGRRWTMLDDQGRLLFVAYEVQPET
jgi:hypothetical protein